MRTPRNWLMVSGLLLLLASISTSQPQASDPVELFRYPGLLWLSWSTVERENFVYGFIQGYGHGVVEACRGTDQLFEKNKPHLLGHDNVPSTFPSARCRAGIAQYSQLKINLSKGPDFSYYTTIITEFYAKHPDYRDTPLTSLMGALAGTQGLTADDIYRRWTAHGSKQ